MPFTAKVVRIVGSGDEARLVPDERVLRDPRRGELLVEVVAAGLNRADVLQRKGLYPAPQDYPPDVPGLEYAGVVLSAGPGGARRAAGDRVMGLVGGGAMSSHLVVPEDETIAVPPGMPLEQAAAIPESFVTAWDALWGQAELRAGELCLVHAVGSGLGTAALQLALARGATVVGTSRTADKLARCRELGLEHGLLVERATREAPARFAEALVAATQGRLADVVLDVAGAAYLAENLRVLERRGRLVVLGLLGGATAPIDLGLLLARRARLIGSVLRSREADEKAALAAGFEREVLPLFAEGRLRPVVDAVLPMREVAAAHGRLERNETFGKLVLAW